MICVHTPQAQELDGAGILQWLSSRYVIIDYKMSLYMRHKITRLVYNKHNKVVSDYIQKEAII